IETDANALWQAGTFRGGNLYACASLVPAGGSLCSTSPRPQRAPVSGDAGHATCGCATGHGLAAWGGGGWAGSGAATRVGTAEGSGWACGFGAGLLAVR